MATVKVNGQLNWKLARNREGQREYRLTSRVITDSSLVGPAEVILTPGLPQIGDIWQVDSDIDTWAFCTPEATVTPVVTKEKNFQWNVVQVFSTVQSERCQDTQIEDPLLEPQGVSGNFVKTTEEVYQDRFDNNILSSSLEPYTGAEVTFDRGYPAVRIEQNVASLELYLFSGMINTVNDAALWGLSQRMIKLSNVSWARKVLGKCGYYYTRVFDFDIRYETWDKVLQDSGTRVLNGDYQSKSGEVSYGRWSTLPVAPGIPADKTNPTHFITMLDRSGEVIDKVMLNGDGEPAENSDPRVDWVYYAERATNGDLWAQSKMIKAAIKEGIDPSAIGLPPSDPGYWYLLGLTLGDNTTGIAEVYLEYYDESNFLLLGIPTVL